MFPAILIVAMLAALVAAILAWHKERALLLQWMLRLGCVVLAIALAASVLGVPLFLFRTGRLQLTPDTVSRWHLVHHYAGRFFVTCWSLYWPPLVFVSIARPKKLWQRLLFGGGAVACVFLFLFVAFTGYLLPTHLNTPTDARYAARFFLLHVKVVPPLAAIALIILLRQHWRATISATESPARD